MHFICLGLQLRFEASDIRVFRKQIALCILNGVIAHPEEGIKNSSAARGDVLAARATAEERR